MNFKKSSFQDKANKYLSTFIKTRDDLNSLNEEIKADSQAKSEKIKALQEELDSNDILLKSNIKVINNIEAILS